MTTSHRFRIRKGATVVDGKKVYPNYITVEMDRHTALDIIVSLASQLRTDQKLFRIEALGKLTTEKDEVVIFTHA